MVTNSSPSAMMGLPPPGFVFALWTSFLLFPVSSYALDLPSFLRPSSSTSANLAAKVVTPTPIAYDGYQIWLGNNFVFRPAFYYHETGVLGICLLFVLLHLVGKQRNRMLGQRWAKAALPLLQQEFAAVAESDGKGNKGPLMWNGGAEAFLFASGRRGCQSLNVNLKLKPRHDLLERVCLAVFDIAIASTVPSARDSLVLTFTLPQTADNLSGVFALVDKAALQATRSGRFDLTFTKVNDSDTTVTSRGLSNQWAVLSEAPDLTDQILGEPDTKGAAHRDKIGLTEALKSKAGDLLESLVLTDQPADRPTFGPIPVESRQRLLILTLRVPRSDTEAQHSLALIHLAVNLVDALDQGVIKPRSETMAKLKKTRAEIDKQLYEEATKEEREAEKEAKEEAKRKAEKEKLDKLSPAEQAKRKEIEKKRELKKAGMKRARG